MKSNITQGDKSRSITVIPKPEYISWEQITELVHLAYSERAAQGVNFRAVNQDVQTTMDRVRDGVCFVALYADRLVGMTAVFIEKHKKPKWFEDKINTHWDQLAVDPMVKGTGIGGHLMDKVVEYSKIQGVEAMTFSTSMEVKGLVNWYVRRGAQKVRVKSNRSTNYYSVVFRLPIKGPRLNPIYVRLRYGWSYLSCILMKRKDGSARKWLRELKNSK